MTKFYCPNKSNIDNVHIEVNKGDPGFQVRGAHLKKLRRVEAGAKIVGVFRVKNHDFTLHTISQNISIL
jgi:hypothetical protein